MFHSTRIPATVFENFEDDLTIDQIVQLFDGLTRAQVNAVLDFAAHRRRGSGFVGFQPFPALEFQANVVRENVTCFFNKLKNCPEMDSKSLILNYLTRKSLFLKDLELLTL